MTQRRSLATGPLGLSPATPSPSGPAPSGPEVGCGWSPGNCVPARRAGAALLVATFVAALVAALSFAGAGLAASESASVPDLLTQATDAHRQEMRKHGLDPIDPR